MKLNTLLLAITAVAYTVAAPFEEATKISALSRDKQCKAACDLELKGWDSKQCHANCVKTPVNWKPTGTTDVDTSKGKVPGLCIALCFIFWPGCAACIGHHLNPPPTRPASNCGRAVAGVEVADVDMIAVPEPKFQAGS